MTQTDNTQANYADYAAQALAANERETASKGKATTLAFTALYLASHDSKLGNQQLERVAFIGSKEEKSNAYRLAFASVFGKAEEEEGRKIPASFSNKMKLAFDVLAYVRACEEQAGVKLVIAKGDKVKVNGRLLDPTDPTEEDCWYSLDASAKMRASVTELQRKARKFLPAVNDGEGLPSQHDGKTGAKGANKEANKAGLSASEVIALSTSLIARMQDSKVSPDLLDAIDTLRDSCTAVLVQAAEAAERAEKKAAKQTTDELGRVKRRTA